MRTHLNTLFITLENAYLCKDGAAVEVRHENQTKLRIPLHNLDGIVTFGWDIGCSPQLMAACAEQGVSLTFHSPHGKFLAAVTGFSPGNVLLRREQYRRADHPEASALIARSCVAAKIANSRHVVQRTLRDHGAKDATRERALAEAAAALGNRAETAARCMDLDELRGIEGESATLYFGVFNHLLTAEDPALRMDARARRPPTDPVNALLSFVYTLLAHDVRSACESAGLDAAVGFLHRDRPGRPGLALDLMEEFRAPLADRLVLSLLNRKQVGTKDFRTEESGAVFLKDDSRKIVLAEWQERKRTEIHHRFLDEKTTIGLLPHLQARLLARHLRGDLDGYPAYLWQ